MKSAEIRKSFLGFFGARGHKVVASDSLVPANDPTLLFTVAGMVQFKPLFVAKDKPYARATSCQRCIRTNDIERVGSTDRHLTFFEMLGNFSFGDYFKEGAIEYAWEYLTKVLKLDSARMYITVFEKDDDAERIWRKFVPAERIIRLGNEDNYWPAGSVLDTWAGPNGACSEIFYDFGAKHCMDPKHPCAKPGVHDCDRWREIWNLVFPQFMRNSASGENPPMPKPGIDTGMGFERVVAAMQGKDSIFETDLFAPLFTRLADIIPHAGKGELPFPVLRARRIISDHTRSAVFLVSDGIIPSNEGRGYVLRRLIRRAVGQGYLHGGKEFKGRPIASTLVPAVVDVMGDTYPEIRERQEAVTGIIRDEEERFLETVERGMVELEKMVETQRGTPLSGERAFFLYDTYGFPMEMTRDIWAQEKGLKLSTDFDGECRRALEVQQERARAAWKGSGGRALGDLYHALANELGATPFLGYQHMSLRAKVVAVVRRGSEGKEGVRVKEARAGETVDVILDRTPFYAESGGQVTDTGKLLLPGDKAEVLEVQKPVGGMFVHTVRVAGGTLAEGAEVGAEVDSARRWSIMRHHTATHLIHAALRQVVGSSATQAGSLVAPDRLRFDFASGKAVTGEQLRAIEEMVNAKVLENLPVTVWETSIDEAKKRGAMALFGEKYGEHVRMLEIADYSRELCGGTHVPSTGHIGTVIIVSESAVAAGVRRIEAVAGTAALAMVFAQREDLGKAAALLKCPPTELVSRVEKMMGDHRALEDNLGAFKSKVARQDLEKRFSGATEIGGVKVLMTEAEADNPAVLRDLADRALEELKEGVVVIGSRGEGKCHIVARVSPALAKRVTAGELVKAAAEAVGGSGGGKPEMAQAGGKLPGKLPEALARARELLVSKLGLR